MRRCLAAALCAALLIVSGVSGAAEAKLPKGVEKGITVDRFTMNGNEGVKWAAQSIASAKKDVLLEVFALSDKRVVRAVNDRIDEKVPVRGNADPETIGSKLLRSLIRAGADFRPWGGNGIRKGAYDRALNPRKVHAKAVHFDDRSWLSTASLLRTKDGAPSIDATAIVSGKDAAAARKITERAYKGDIRGMRTAANGGRRRGILLNDSSAKIKHLTEGMNDVIDGAKRELIVSVKVLESPDFAQKLSAAADRGVNVTLFTHRSKMSRKAAAALSPDVRVLSDPYGLLHANMIVADQEVGIFGSAHATSRALGEGARRKSHEMGYVVTDSSVLGEMRRAVLAFATEE